MKAVIITGASGAIGGALCKAFKDAGYRVIATDVAAGAECDAFVKADLAAFATNERQRASIAAKLRKAVGRAKLTTLVNNAATQRLGATQEVTQEDWDGTLAVNLSAPFFLAQAFADDLAANRGSVVNIASIHATLTKPRFVAYATSKAALVGLSHAMAVDLGGRLRVNAISPAAIGTPMLHAGFNGDKKRLAALANHHPTRSIGTPAEVANLAVALAGDGMAFLTGAVISLDGAIGSRLHDPE